MIVDKEGNSLSTEKESHIRKSLKALLANHIPMATTEQVNLVSDLMEHSIMENLMQSYREGFHNGGVSNGGMNRAAKMVLSFQRACGSPSMFSPTKCDDDRIYMYLSELDEIVNELESITTIQDESVPEEGLRILSKMMHVQMRLAWELGIADMMTEGFEEVHAAYMSFANEKGVIAIGKNGWPTKGDNYSPPKIKPLIDKKLMVADKIRKDLEALKELENEDHYKRPLTVEDIMPRTDDKEEKREEPPQ